MAEFDTWQDYLTFETKIRQENRYIQDESTLRFLDNVLKTAHSRTIVLRKESKLHRAQLGCAKVPFYSDTGEHLMDEDEAYPKKRMTPLPDEAKEGRMNPKGIPFLYLSEKDKTAMSEIRPWIGAYLTLGVFKTCRELRLVNCCEDNFDLASLTSLAWYYEEPEPLIREQLVWSYINRVFSTPVTINDKTADYCATQVLAEFFKVKGFDGIIYKSSLDKGRNYVLFDTQSAECSLTSLFRVNAVDFEFKPKNFFDPIT